LTISGRTYEYGCDTGWYEAYFREQSSDVKDRPVAMVSENYTLTFSPVDSVLFVPHKGTVQGRVGNRVISDAVVSENDVVYPGFYEEIGSSDSFANVTFEYMPEYIKENFVMWDKVYVQDRFASQCNPEDYSIVNMTFSEIVRVYDTSDQDNMTSGIVYGANRTKFKEYGEFEDNELITNETIYFTDATNETVYTIRQLYAYDSNNNSILLDKVLSMTLAGNLEITVLVPYFWLNETAVFPVFVDPTVWGEIHPPVVDTVEWDEQEGRNTGLRSVCRVNNTEYWAITPCGDSGADEDGWVRVLQVYNADGTIPGPVDSYEYDATDGYYANILAIPDSDKYLIAYRDTTSAKVTLVTVQIWENGTIHKTNIDTQQLTYDGMYVVLYQLSDEVFAVTYMNAGDNDGFIETFRVYTNGTIGSLLDIEEFDEAFAARPYMCVVDGNTVAITYNSVGANGDYSLVTYDVNFDTGIIDDTQLDKWDYETEPDGHSYIDKIGDETFEVIYVSDDDIYAKTLSISDAGAITESFIDTLTVETGDTTAYLQKFTVMDPLTASNGQGVVGATAQGLIGNEKDGYMWTWNVSSNGTLGDSYISKFEFDTSDNKYFAKVMWVSKNYYLVVYTSTGDDGYASTVYIDTNSGIPEATDPYPANSATNVELQPMCNITVSDDNGDTMDVTFAENSTGIWINRQTNATVSNGTYQWQFTQATNYSTTYYWRVYVDDGYSNISYTYHFDTFGTNPPTAFTSSPINRTAIYLSWSKGLYAEYTYVVAQQNTYPASREAGTNIYNGTGTEYTHSNLCAGEHWFYRAWSFNATLGWSTTYAETNNYTVMNIGVSFSNEDPVNGSSNQPTTLLWSIYMEDAEGDPFDWLIECNNTQSNTSSDDINGTKYLSLSGLVCNITYTIDVSATDGCNWTYAWYVFTVRDFPPFPTDFTAIAYNRTRIDLSWTPTDIECNNTQFNSSNGDVNGTKHLSLSGLAYNTTYTVWVNATDGYDWTREWFQFTTISNLPPDEPIIPITPLNHSEYEGVYNQHMNVTVTDSDGGTLDVYFYWANHTLIGSDLDVPSGTNASIFLPDFIVPEWLLHDTVYYWYVNVSDGVDTVTSPIWTFNTSKAWDCNEDKTIDYLDASILVSNYGGSGYLPGEISSDIVEDGTINYLDGSLLVTHYGESY